MNPFKKGANILAKQKIKNPDASSYCYLQLQQDIQNTIAPSAILQVPPEHIAADLTVSGVDPRNTDNAASALEGLFGLSHTEVAGPFLNITLDKEVMYDRILQEVMTHDAEYGYLNTHAGESAVVEYSSPNIAKSFGVGHLRSTIIGEALVRLYRANGYSVLRENHLGDWGTQFGKLLYAYQTWGNPKAVTKNPIPELKALYVRFQKESEEHEELNDEARALFQQLESGDPTLTALWKKFRALSIESFEEVYKRLNVDFDVYGGESYYIHGAEDIVQECLDHKVCTRGDEQAVVAEVEHLPTFLLQKQDGATLYHTRDLIALKQRLELYHPDILVYVVGAEQTLYFQQLFGLAKALEYIQNSEVTHVSFGSLLIDGKRMSTRRGTAIELSDVLDQSVARAHALVQKKSPDLSQKTQQRIAEEIGIGAVIYNDLRQSRTKDISFDWDKMLNIEAGSAVYLQYTYARIRSLLEKADQRLDTSGTNTYTEEHEWQVARHIMRFPEVIQDAMKRQAPHVLCGYLEGLAQAFNTFYNAVPVVKTEDTQLRISRLRLVYAVGVVIKNGLDILNVKTPERM